MICKIGVELQTGGWVAKLGLICKICGWVAKFGIEMQNGGWVAKLGLSCKMGVEFQNLGLSRKIGVELQNWGWVAKLGLSCKIWDWDAKWGLGHKIRERGSKHTISKLRVHEAWSVKFSKIFVLDSFKNLICVFAEISPLSHPPSLPACLKIHFLRHMHYATLVDKIWHLVSIKLLKTPTLERFKLISQQFYLRGKVANTFML